MLFYRVIGDKVFVKYLRPTVTAFCPGPWADSFLFVVGPPEDVEFVISRGPSPTSALIEAPGWRRRAK